MSFFHISAAKNIVTITRGDNDFYIEREVKDIPASILVQITRALGTVDLIKPVWTKIALEVSKSSDFYLWFIYERADDVLKGPKPEVKEDPYYWDDEFEYLDLNLSENILDRIYS